MVCEMDRFQNIFKSHAFKYGLPFFLTVVGGSIFLQQFTSLRYKFSKNSAVTRADLEKAGIKLRDPKELTLEAQYEEIKALNIDNWEQKRIQRPWDEEEESKS